MLFVLTGNVQIGKTRWLESLVDELARKGVASYGVIAPGTWVDRRNRRDRRDRRGTPVVNKYVDANGFEKTSIDNVLLPSGERIPFARRLDLAAQEGKIDADSQSSQAKLFWNISDEAIAQVNAHFEQLREGPVANSAQAPGLLVVDELGRLELLRGEGLTEAMQTLEEGPTETLRHALIVVREQLLPHLGGRFAKWGEQVQLAPDEQSRIMVIETFSQ